MLTAIVGINWGDEGKGRMVDLLSGDQQIVVRYQGDHSSEHTIVTEQGRFVLNLLPAGILRPDVVCVMGNGMAIDPAHLESEIASLLERGILVSPDRLKISDRAPVILPYHIATEQYELKRQGGDARRSCGVSAVYGDRALNLAIRMGDLLHPAYLRARLEKALGYKNAVIRGVYDGETVTVDEVVSYALGYDIFAGTKFEASSFRLIEV